MSLRDDLKEARSLIAVPETWCQGASVMEIANGVFAHCALGALGEVTIGFYGTINVGDARNGRYYAAQAALDASAEALYGTKVDPDLLSPLVYVNDFLGHEAVLNVYDRAIALADGDDA